MAPGIGINIYVIQIDSIPAVFGVTRDPLIILSSNIFAISGLRSLYVLVSESMGELEYLQVNIHNPLSFLRFLELFSIYLSILNI
ncbi:Protein alx [Zea mays]|uniref:Protein alx n=1 Tax=Zea mays TaxID=4577 RepID=A0A1D6LGZ7_MAIZE|nr:Protein alx [Zea mays]